MVSIFVIWVIIHLLIFQKIIRTISTESERSACWKWYKGSFYESPWPDQAPKSPQLIFSTKYVIWISEPVIWEFLPRLSNCHPTTDWVPAFLQLSTGRDSSDDHLQSWCHWQCCFHLSSLQTGIEKLIQPAPCGPGQLWHDISSINVPRVYEKNRSRNRSPHLPLSLLPLSTQLHRPDRVYFHDCWRSYRTLHCSVSPNVLQ